MDKKNQKNSKLSESIIQVVNANHPSSIDELVDLMYEKHSLSKEEILQSILTLQKHGKIDFKKNKTRTPSKLMSYLLSYHSFWYWLLLGLTIVTTIIVFTIKENTLPLIYLRYISGLLFTLFLPGYSLIKLLFQEKILDITETTALSIGMSLAILPTTGLILNYTPWGITTISITLSLLTLTIIFATAAILREHKIKTK